MTRPLTLTESLTIIAQTFLICITCLLFGLGCVAMLGGGGV